MTEYQRLLPGNPHTTVPEVLRHAYPLYRDDKRVVVVGNGKETNKTWAGNGGLVFAGWVSPGRNTDAANQIVTHWLTSTRAAYVFAVVESIYVILLWATLLVKVLGWSLLEFDQYFTNWSWFVQALFYTADLACYVDDSRYAHYLLLLVGWWPMYMTVVAVFVFVHVVIAIDSKLFIQAVHDFGVGPTILGHIYVHIIPLVVLLLWLWARSGEITDSIAMLRDVRRRYHGRLVVYVTLNFLYSLILIACYAIINDYRKVYHVKLHAGFALMLILVFYIVLYCFTLWLLLPRDSVESRVLKPSVVQVKHVLV